MVQAGRRSQENFAGTNCEVITLVSTLKLSIKVYNVKELHFSAVVGPMEESLALDRAAGEIAAGAVFY